MDVKRITIIALLLFVTACSERDQAYYAANIDAAEEKAEDCEASMLSLIHI